MVQAPGDPNLKSKLKKMLLAIVRFGSKTVLIESGEISCQFMPPGANIIKLFTAVSYAFS